MTDVEEYLLSGIEPDDIRWLDEPWTTNSNSNREQIQTYLSFVRFSHSVFALPFALTGALLALQRQPDRRARHCLARALDRRRDGGGAQRGDGVQPAGRRQLGREESADGDARDPRGAMTRREAVVFVLVSSVASSAPRAQLGRICLVLSPVALAIVFWYSLAKRFTTYTQLFLALAMAVAPVGGWLAAGGPIGAMEPWLLGAAIGAWVGGFDILYACQDLDFDRAAGLKSIPVRFGVRDSLLISRAHARHRRRLPGRPGGRRGSRSAVSRRRRRWSPCCSSTSNRWSASTISRR